MTPRALHSVLTLHRDQRGTLSPMILVVTIALAYMIVWIMNTGQTIYDKQRTQDTADAVALVHADWTSRSLNIMAMNNVGSSQATVIGATAVAFQLTTADLAYRSGQVVKKLQEYMTDWEYGPPSILPPMPPMPYCPWYQAIIIDFGIIHKACLAFQGFRMTMAAAAIGYVVYTEGQYDPVGIAFKMNDIIDAMNKANEDLVKRLPERISVNAMTLASVNRVDHVVFHPPCQSAESCGSGREALGADLPVERELDSAPVAYQEMCIAMEHGTGNHPVPDPPIPSPMMRDAYQKRGFPQGKGPLTAGGKGDKPSIRDHVNDESSVGQWLHDWQFFYDAFGDAYDTKVPLENLIEKYLPEDAKFSYGWGPFSFDWKDAMKLGMTAMKAKFGVGFGVTNPFQLPIDHPPRYDEFQDVDENDFTRTFDKTWEKVCEGPGAVLSFLTVLPQPYWLKGRTLGTFDAASSRESGDQMSDYRSLAVVSRAPRIRLQKGLFKDAVPSAYALAESWAHNYTAFDLYTQDWRAALAPISHAGDDTLTGTLRASPAASAFEKLANSIDQGGADGFAALTTH